MSGSKGRKEKRHLDELLDEDLKGTFPASDPVSRKVGPVNTRLLALSLSIALVVSSATQAMTVLVGMGHSIDVPRIVIIVSALGMIGVC
jgi:hypothetical protein